MTVQECSLVTGWSIRFIREMCKSGVLGSAFCGGKGFRYKCVPFPGKVAEALGISTEELERRLHDTTGKGSGMASEQQIPDSP